MINLLFAILFLVVGGALAAVGICWLKTPDGILPITMGILEIALALLNFRAAYHLFAAWLNK